MTRTFLSGSVIIAVICIYIIMPCIAMSLYAQTSRKPSQNIAAPFDVSEIIEQVSHHPINQGDKIVIKDRVYEAFFDESGVVLKAKETKQSAEDLVISINGKPEIRDGEIVYRTKYGEIVFEGYGKGLRFKEIYKSPGFNSAISNYSGNVAKLDREMVTDWSRTGEFLIDTNIVYVPTLSLQSKPSMAFDGTNYLVVWEDKRNGWSYSDIYGTRVSVAGIVLDPAGFKFNIVDSAISPSVAFGNTNYLVVWVANDSLFGARITMSGSILDSAGFVIADSVASPTIAFDSTNYLVVWANKCSDLTTDIYGTRVSQTGTVLDSSGIAITTAVNMQESPAVDFDGTNYLVVWQDNRSSSNYDIYGARVSTTGTVLDSSGFGIAIETTTFDKKDPSVAFDGTNYLVVWSLAGDIYGTRVSQPGSPLSDIAISKAPNHQENPSVAFDGLNYFVVWDDKRNNQYNADIYGARVNQAGSVLDSSGIAISTIAYNDETFPSVIFDGINFFVVWGDERDILGARVDTSGTILDSSAIAISTTANTQNNPSVAFDGTNYLVVWDDYRSDATTDIYGSLVSSTGMILDSLAIAISNAVDNQNFPAVAFDGNNYLVVWQDERKGRADIYGARVSQIGTILDPSGFEISTLSPFLISSFPSVAFDGTNYLVVWQVFIPVVGVYEIYGARVSPTGIVLDPLGINISIDGLDQWFPSVAFDGNNYLVVWQDQRCSSCDIYGARVDASGNVLDPAGIAISTDDNVQDYPSIAFDGSNYLVVWQDSRLSTYRDIYGARVSPIGMVLDPLGIAISNAVNNQNFPEVAFDGNNYLVVWQDDRSGSSYDIYGAKINPAGIVIDSFAISTQSGNQHSPALAYGHGNQLFITYSGYTDYINGNPADALRIWGKFYPFMGIEEDAQRLTPDALRLLEIYPNPFSNKINIRWHTDQNTESLELKIYDVTGRIVKNFGYLSSYQSPFNQLIWNGVDDYGLRLPAGVYFVGLKSDNFNTVEKIILLK